MPGRSGHHTKVEFRYVVFRPFIEEILVGKVKSCNKDYVQGNNLFIFKMTDANNLVNQFLHVLIYFDNNV